MDKLTRKSQITLFVIIGITLLVVVTLILMKMNQDKLKDLITQQPKKNSTGEYNEIIYDEKVRPVVTQVETCMKDSLVESMKLIGDQGQLEPSSYLASKNTKIAYFYFKGKNNLPKNADFEKKISEHIKESMTACPMDFSKYGIEVDFHLSELKPEVIIEEDSIITTLNYPITVYKDGKEYEFEEFRTEASSGFSDILALTGKIIDTISDDPDWISLDYEYPKNMELKIIKIDKNTLVYEISHLNYINELPYRYRFGVKYEE
jgi:hypothetical protein